MRKHILPLAVLLLTVSVASSQATTWFSDSFDSYQLGNLPGQGGWAGHVDGVRVVSNFSGTGKSARADYKNYDIGDATHATSSGTGYHLIDVDIAMDCAGASYGTNLGYIKFMSSGGQELTRIYIAQNQLKVLVAPADAVSIQDNCTMRTWYHVRLGIDLTYSRIDVWVDGAPKVQGANLYRSGTSIGSIVIGQWGSGFTKSEMYVDNFACSSTAQNPAAMLPWVSPDRYRVVTNVNPRGVARRNSPATVRLDLPALLAAFGGSGVVDESTIEVVAYDYTGAPVVFDATRTGSERYLLPWHTQRYYGVNYVDLSFTMPNHTYTQYVVYFDTVQSGLGKPQRYSGLVGDGDYFREGYKRREINACHFDHFVDFDGDGDLDLFKGGVEPFVYCYENVGGNRMVDRGRLTSGGNLFTLPASADNRSWMTVAFYDWDGDGDLDFLPSFYDGPDMTTIVYYKNTTTPGGQLTYTRVGTLKTVSGTDVAGGAQAGGWFPSIAFVGDWDGDGHAGSDILVGSNNRCWLYRSIGRDANGSPRLADAVAIQAGGVDIDLSNPRFDVADIDNDGDLDLFAGCQPGPVYWYCNIGTRTAPVFAPKVVVAYATPYYIGDAHSGVKVADWDGDGLKDIVVGRYWERTPSSEASLPRYFGGLYKNVGTPTQPVFQQADAYHGSPYTERFQICDADRQNGVRTVDWNNDGKPDLIAGDTDGYVWYFRNLAGPFFPVFDTGVRLKTGRLPLCVQATGGHARPDIADWNNDGKKDLIVADGSGAITLFLNEGTDASPAFTAGQRLSAGDPPALIDSPGSRSSVMVCDWDNDGKKDIVQADDSNASGGYYFYRNVGEDYSPVLAARVPIAPNDEYVDYTRPNLGSFVDWDGDGVKDFIGCNFENNVRFYQNTSGGGVGVEPSFDDAAGVVIVHDYSIMMISGADAKDWNSDGDLDILTGQGHGGSGLRFYERDYINDVNNGTLPIATVAGSEYARTIPEVKMLPNGTTILLTKMIVSACYSGVFYVQSSDRLAAMRVELAGHALVEGEIVDVRGAVQTNPAGERYIAATSVTLNP